MTVRGAILTWAALVLLLITTLALAYVPMGLGNTVASLGIAAVKAALIMLIYMKLWRGPALHRFAAAMLGLWLAIMIGITFTDYLTRPKVIESPEVSLPQPGPGQP